MKLKGLAILAMIVAMCAFVASAFTPPTPFMISGWANDSTGSPVNHPIVTITNQTTGKVFTAETDAGSHYYQFVLANSTDVNVSEVLRFEATSPDGSQSKIFDHTVTQDEINDGGIFDFNISLEPVQIIFDTGHGTYPSIMGVHEGNFTPECNITVHQIYTYPCVGTGGHTEHVRIWNDTWVGKEAHWKGYQDDWRNITFDEPFMLFAEKTYHYEIKTGSYPQIIHNQTCPNAFGTMTCTKFTDANGREYKDWIPAIRLG